jgi:hypothetical protein
VAQLSHGRGLVGGLRERVRKSIDDRVRDSFWDGANLYVMILKT